MDNKLEINLIEISSYYDSSSGIHWPLCLDLNTLELHGPRPINNVVYWSSDLVGMCGASYIREFTKEVDYAKYALLNTMYGLGSGFIERLIEKELQKSNEYEIEQKKWDDFEKSKSYDEICFPEINESDYEGQRDYT